MNLCSDEEWYWRLNIHVVGAVTTRVWIISWFNQPLLQQFGVILPEFFVSPLTIRRSNIWQKLGYMAWREILIWCKLSKLLFGGLWEILKSRCRHRFDNQPMNHLDIITRTYGHLNETCRLILRTDTNNTGENTTLDAFRIPSFRGPTSRGKWVAWRKPGGRRW